MEIMGDEADALTEQELTTYFCGVCDLCGADLWNTRKCRCGHWNGIKKAIKSPRSNTKRKRRNREYMRRRRNNMTEAEKDEERRKNRERMRAKRR